MGLITLRAECNPSVALVPINTLGDGGIHGALDFEHGDDGGGLLVDDEINQ